MKRCYCPSCRARDTRDFERIIAANYSASSQTVILAQAVSDTVGRTVVERIAQYGRLALPAIPEWEGEPTELFEEDA